MKRVLLLLYYYLIILLLLLLLLLSPWSLSSGRKWLKENKQRSNNDASRNVNSNDNSNTDSITGKTSRLLENIDEYVIMDTDTKNAIDIVEVNSNNDHDDNNSLQKNKDKFNTRNKMKKRENVCKDPSAIIMIIEEDCHDSVDNSNNNHTLDNSNINHDSKNSNSNINNNDDLLKDSDCDTDTNINTKTKTNTIANITTKKIEKRLFQTNINTSKRL